MTILYLLIPLTLCMGLVALGAFLWSLRTGQYEDLAGAAERVLLDTEDAPLPRSAGPNPRRQTTEEPFS